ncbi:MAG: hypothetical protein QM730_27185 [Anaerolineales bacterium]
MMDKLKAIIQGGVAQFGKLWKMLLFLYLPIALLYILLQVLSRSIHNISLSDFTYDVTILGGLPFYAGMLSQLGIMFWSATAAVCVLAFILLKRQNKNGPTKRFLFHAIAFTIFLLLDDAFIFHEDIAPNYLGIGQNIVFALYLFVYLVFFLVNISEILNSEYLILGFAMALFAASIFIDVAHLDHYELQGIFFSERFQTFLEDGLKFAGIVTWFIYFTRYSIQSLERPGIEIQSR